jgi:hypothetical protein
MTDIIIDTTGIGPIGLQRDDIETVMLNKMPGDRCAGAVEFRCAMRGLAQQYHPRIAKAVEAGAELCCLGGVGQWFGMATQHRHEIRRWRLVCCGSAQFGTRQNGVGQRVAGHLDSSFCRKNSANRIDDAK